METVKETNQDNFENDVLQSSGPILVDFWAEWCRPCKILAPILDEVAEELQKKAQIFKVNVDQNKNLAQQYGIKGIPTMIFFKDGQVFKTLIGPQQKEEIQRSLEELL